MAASVVLKKFAPFLILIAVPLSALSPLWFHAHAMAFDVADYFLPNRYFLSECLRNRIFPWWNPYSGLGIPFHADPQSGAFYPVAWIIGILFGYNFSTINFEYILHVVIAGWGMYRLMYAITKSVTASVCMALCYQLCGVFIGNAQHLTWIISAAWLPWVIFYWRNIFRQGNYIDTLTLAFCLMMMTTGGYPAFIIVIGYIAIVYSLIFISQQIFRREFQALWQFLFQNVLLLSFYCMITLPYIVSFLQAYPHFTRAIPLGSSSYTSPFSFAAVISLLFPMATLSHINFYHADQSMLNGYFGLLPIIYLIAMFITRQSRNVWVIFLVAGFILFISFGNDFFLWKFLFNYSPLMNRIRFPASFRLFAIFGFIITAGIVMSNVNTYKRIIPASLILLALIFGFIIFSVLDEYRLMLPQSFSIEGIQQFFAASTITNNVLVQSFIQVLLVVALTITFLNRNKISQPRFHIMLIILVAADLIFATRMNLPVSVVSRFPADSLNMKLKFEPKGFSVSLEKNLSDFTHEGNGSYAPSYYNNNIFKKQLSPNNYNPFDLKNKDSLDRYKWRNDLLQHPLFYISNNVIPYPAHQSDTLVHLQNGVVLLDDDLVESLEIQRRDSLITDLRIQKFIPGKIILNAHTNEHALLTMLQNYYPGWKATVDGKSAKIFKSNISMMSIDLQAKDHEVTFQYDPRIIRLLLEISVTAQFLLIGLLLVKRNRRKITSLFESI